MAEGVGYLQVGVALGVAGCSGLMSSAFNRDTTTIAFDVHLEDGGMMDQAIHGCECHSGIWEDAGPFAEGMICKKDHVV